MLVFGSSKVKVPPPEDAGPHSEVKLSLMQNGARDSGKVVAVQGGPQSGGLWAPIAGRRLWLCPLLTTWPPCVSEPPRAPGPPGKEGERKAAPQPGEGAGPNGAHTHGVQGDRRVADLVPEASTLEAGLAVDP